MPLAMIFIQQNSPTLGNWVTSVAMGHLKSEQ